MTRLLCALLSCALLSAVGPRSYGAVPEPGDLWVTFDESGTTLCGWPPPFTTANVFYVATYDVGIAGYEFEVFVNDPNIIIFSVADLTNPGGSINVGTAPYEWIVGIGACVDVSEVLHLVQFTYGFFLPTIADVLVCLGPASPASLNPPAPAYLDCSNDIDPFGMLVNGLGVYPNGCGLIHPSFPLWPCDLAVAVESATWGAVKSRY